MAREQARSLATLAVLLSSTDAGKTTSAHACADAAALFTRLARSYQRLQETACNRDLTPREQTRERRLEERLRAFSATWGLGVTVAGDPRGFVVKLQFPDGASNTWGNDGWGIG